MKDIHSVRLALLRSARGVLIAGMAAAVLAACYRTEPTPDPPPAPPNPQTLMEGQYGIEPGIHPAIFVYPESEIPARRAVRERVAT
jgi:hypothetical protein